MPITIPAIAPPESLCDLGRDIEEGMLEELLEDVALLDILMAKSADHRETTWVSVSWKRTWIAGAHKIASLTVVTVDVVYAEYTVGSVMSTVTRLVEGRLL